jgi:hypothetical protein
VNPDDWIEHCMKKGIPVTVGKPVRVDPPHVTRPPYVPLKPDEVAARVVGKARVVPGKRAFVEVPIPPSVNNLFATVKGRKRVKTAAYKSWQASAEFDLFGLSVPPPPWSIRYTVVAGNGWHQGRDVANVEKATTDLLVSVGLLTNDSCVYVRRVTCEFDPECKTNDVAKLRIQILQWSAGGN